MSEKERQKYKIAGPATWELIRAAYLAGESAPALAERLGVSEHAIRKRITAEKWTKRDYAAALEARGLPPPPKPAPLNIAERFAANYVAPQPRPEPPHPFAELVEALKQASAAAEGSAARSVNALAEEEPSQAAVLLERRALAQAGAALAKGRASDAKTFAALADQMRKRVEVAGAERNAEAAEVRLAQDEAEEMITDLFAKAAYIANAMVHAPAQAPAAFQGLIKLWREHNLGEGEADAERAAARLAESQAAYLEGRFEASLPEPVRARLAEDWKRRREELADEPVIQESWREV